MQPEEAFRLSMARLGGDHAAVVRQEAIHHDAVEAGDAPHLVGEPLAEGLRRRGLLHTQQHGLHLAEPIIGIAVQPRLQLQQQQPAAVMHDRVGFLAIMPRRQGESVQWPRYRLFGGQQAAQAGHAVRREQGLCCTPDQHGGRGAENAHRIAAGLDDRQRLRVERQQSPMRLDGGRTVDRFAVAVGHIRRTEGGIAAAWIVGRLAAHHPDAMGLERIDVSPQCPRRRHGPTMSPSPLRFQPAARVQGR
jgi:hypothetical protein